MDGKNLEFDGRAPAGGAAEHSVDGHEPSSTYRAEIREPVPFWAGISVTGLESTEMLLNHHAEARAGGHRASGLVADFGPGAYGLMNSFGDFVQELAHCSALLAKPLARLTGR